MGSRIVGLRFPPLGSLSDLPACWGKWQMLCSPQYPTVHGARTVAPGMVLFPSVPPLAPASWTKAPHHRNHHNPAPLSHGWGRLTEMGRVCMEGAAQPPTPPWHPQPGAQYPRHWQPVVEAVLAWLGQTEVMGLYTGSSLRCLLGCCWLLQENGAQSRGGTQAGGHRTRTDEAASTAGGAEEPQGWLQSCGAAVGADRSVAQICVATGSWVR